MNYLELVKDLAAESGTVSPSEITTVDGVTDDHVADLVRWIKWANHEIELMHDDWRWRIRDAEFELCADEHTYDVTYQLKDYYKILPYTHEWGRRFVTIGDSRYPVAYIPYDRWAGPMDIKRAHTSGGRPRAFTLDPREKLQVYPTPTEDSVLTFNYSREAQELSETDTCVPGMPDRFHRVIVFKALLDYALSDEAKAQIQRARIKYQQLFRALANDQLPDSRV